MIKQFYFTRVMTLAYYQQGLVSSDYVTLIHIFLTFVFTLLMFGIPRYIAVTTRQIFKYIHNVIK